MEEQRWITLRVAADRADVHPSYMQYLVQLPETPFRIRVVPAGKVRRRYEVEEASFEEWLRTRPRTHWMEKKRRERPDEPMSDRPARWPAPAPV